MTIHKNMPNYILKIILKPKNLRDNRDYDRIAQWTDSVLRCNKDWKRQLDYFDKLTYLLWN